MNLANLQPKHIMGAVAVLIFLYVFFVPWLWPEPEVYADVPETAVLGQDLEIPITVSAWHSNVDVYQVRFYVDYQGSTARGEEGIFHPTVVLQREGQRYRGVWGWNHLTRPWSETLIVTVPLRQFAEEKLLGPGTLSGKVDVSINYHPGRTIRAPYPADHTRQAMLSVPFQMTIQDSP